MQMVSTPENYILYRENETKLPSYKDFVKNTYKDVDLKGKSKLFLPTQLENTSLNLHITKNKRAKWKYAIVLSGVLYNGTYAVVCVEGIRPYFDIAISSYEEPMEYDDFVTISNNNSWELNDVTRNSDMFNFDLKCDVFNYGKNIVEVLNTNTINLERLNRNQEKTIETCKKNTIKAYTFVKAKPFKYYTETHMVFLRLYFDKISDRSNMLKHFHSSLNVVAHMYNEKINNKEDSDEENNKDCEDDEKNKSVFIKPFTVSDSKTNYHRTVANLNNVNFGSWVKFDDYKKYKPNENFATAHYIVNIKNIYDFDENKLSLSIEQPLKLVDKSIIMTWDIETYNCAEDGQVPLPEMSYSDMFMIGIGFHRVHISEPFLRVVISTEPLSQLEDTIVIVTKNETDLILAFSDLIGSMRPNIITGFNDGFYDWPWVIERAKKNKIITKLFHNMSIIKSHSFITSKFNKLEFDQFNYKKYKKSINIKMEASDNNSLQYLGFAGYECIDTRNLMIRLSKKSNKSSLKHFLAENKLEPKEDMPYQTMFDIYKSLKKESLQKLTLCKKCKLLLFKTAAFQKNCKNKCAESISSERKEKISRLLNDMRSVGKYCMIDAHRCQELLLKKNAIGQKRELSKSSMSSFFDAVYRADSDKVVNLNIRMSERRKLLCPLYKRGYKIDDKYPGAYVFSPKLDCVKPKLSLSEIDKVSDLTKEQKAKCEKYRLYSALFGSRLTESEISKIDLIDKDILIDIKEKIHNYFNEVMKIRSVKLQIKNLNKFDIEYQRIDKTNNSLLDAHFKNKWNEKNIPFNYLIDDDEKYKTIEGSKIDNEIIMNMFLMFYNKLIDKQLIIITDLISKSELIIETIFKNVIKKDIQKLIVHDMFDEYFINLVRFNNQFKKSFDDNLKNKIQHNNSILLKYNESLLNRNIITAKEEKKIKAGNIKKVLYDLENEDSDSDSEDEFSDSENKEEYDESTFNNIDEYIASTNPSIEKLLEKIKNNENIEDFSIDNFFKLRNKYPVIGLDFSSLYPSIIMTFNMSPETTISWKIRHFVNITIVYDGNVIDQFNQKDINQQGISQKRVMLNNEIYKRYFPNKTTKEIVEFIKFNDCIKYTLNSKDKNMHGKKLHPISFIFKKSRNEIIGWTISHEGKRENYGVFPSILLDQFEGRKVVKMKMLKVKDTFEYIEANSSKEELSKPEMIKKLEMLKFTYLQLYSIQLNKKLLMNTLYGVSGDSTSALYVIELAGGITCAGKLNIKVAEQIVLQNGCYLYYGDTDSVYISIADKYFALVDKMYFGGIINKTQYCKMLVEITFEISTNILEVINNWYFVEYGTRHTKMAYEEVLFPVFFLAKKIYFAVEHMNSINFDVSYGHMFKRGLGVTKRGVSQFLIDCVKNVMVSVADIHQTKSMISLILEELDRVYTECLNKVYDYDDFVQSDVYRKPKEGKPGNVKVLTFVKKELKRGDPNPVYPGERFNYVITQVDNKQDYRGRRVDIKRGDQMERIEYCRLYKPKIDISYYIEHALTGQFGRLLSYRNEINGNLVKAKKFILQYCVQKGYISSHKLSLYGKRAFANSNNLFMKMIGRTEMFNQKHDDNYTESDFAMMFKHELKKDGYAKWIMYAAINSTSNETKKLIDRYIKVQSKRIKAIKDIKHIESLINMYINDVQYYENSIQKTLDDLLISDNKDTKQAIEYIHKIYDKYQEIIKKINDDIIKVEIDKLIFDKFGFNLKQELKNNSERIKDELTLKKENDILISKFNKIIKESDSLKEIYEKKHIQDKCISLMNNMIKTNEMYDEYIAFTKIFIEPIKFYCKLLMISKRIYRICVNTRKSIYKQRNLKYYNILVDQEKEKKEVKLRMETSLNVNQKSLLDSMKAQGIDTSIIFDPFDENDNIEGLLF